MTSALLKASLNLLIALITLGLAWFIGNRLSVKWNLIQKRRETDIANVQEFYALYGEFKEVSKLWRVFKRNEDSSLMVPSETRWSLLARACEIESKNETIVVKLATERLLEANDLKALGLFRQALQTLRESLRDNLEIPFSSRGPEYVFFNDLAAKVALIISSSHLDETSDPNSASKRLSAIANIRLPDFQAAIKTFKETHPEYTSEETRPTISRSSPFLIVADVPATLSFYRDMLGFEVVFRGPTPDDEFFGIVRRDDAMIMFKALGVVSDGKEVVVEPVPNYNRKPAFSWDAYLEVPDPDALAAEYESRGVHFSVPLGNNDDGLRGFVIEDINGYGLFFGHVRG